MRKIYFLLACFLTLQHIAIAKSPDAGNFTFSVDASSNVIFINTSILGNEPGDRKAYWSFGDGTVAITGVLLGTQHHYSTAGNFTVCLKIYRYRSNLNDSVLSAEVCKSITIQSFCEADFERLTGASLNNPLRTEFKAKFFNNTNKKPAKIPAMMSTTKLNIS